MTQSLYHPRSDVTGFVGVNEIQREIVVCFRGTNSVENFIVDLQFFKLDFDYPGAVGARIVRAPRGARATGGRRHDARARPQHKGFYTAYEEVSAHVQHAVAALHRRYPTFRVFVTGHSLGGALATIAALDLSKRMPQVPVQHYTFGEPRVGNDKFAAYFNHSVANSMRHVHWHDWVAHLPLRAMNFWHIPSEVFEQKVYQGPESVRLCDFSGEDMSCANRFPGGYSIPDHLVYLGEPLGRSAC